jgi:type II secretory pathway component GspD/PulD (secretin)
VKGLLLPVLAALSPRGAAEEGVLIRLGGAVEPASAAAAAPPPWSGPLVNLSFERAEIHSVFRVMSQLTGLNFVLDDSVRGEVTLHLEAVPAELALAALLLQQGLGMTWIGGGADGAVPTPGAVVQIGAVGLRGAPAAP